MWQSAHARPFALSPSSLRIEERQKTTRHGIAGFAAAGGHVSSHARAGLRARLRLRYIASRWP